MQTAVGQVLIFAGVNHVVIKENIFLVSSFHVVTYIHFIIGLRLGTLVFEKAANEALNLLKSAILHNSKTAINLFIMSKYPQGKRVLFIDKLKLVFINIFFTSQTFLLLFLILSFSVSALYCQIK